VTRTIQRTPTRQFLTFQFTANLRHRFRFGLDQHTEALDGVFVRWFCHLACLVRIAPPTGPRDTDRTFRQPPAFSSLSLNPERMRRVTICCYRFAGHAFLQWLNQSPRTAKQKRSADLSAPPILCFARFIWRTSMTSHRRRCQPKTVLRQSRVFIHSRNALFHNAHPSHVGDPVSYLSLSTCCRSR
jgi:hypothetical protein